MSALSSTSRPTAPSSLPPTAPSPSSTASEQDKFEQAARLGCNVIPICRRIFSDQLTPVVAYRCLTRQSSDINAPSFLFESVVNGDQQGRYSFLGAMPAMEVVATGNKVVFLDHNKGTRKVTEESDPMLVPEALSRGWKPAIIEGLPQVFTGGWVGYAGYDTVR
jgi:anthranilate synthase component 1